MSKLHRFLSVGGFLGIAAILSSSLQGQPDKKASTTPQIAPAQQVSRLAEPTDSRFTAPGVLTYRPLQGAAYFALALQPNLDPAPRRPRDILIMLSTAATQAGPSWIAAHQIAEAILATASENDRISLWTVNTPENTRQLTTDFLLAKDIGQARRLRDTLTAYRNKQYPAGDTDLKHALTEAVKSFDASKDRQRILLFLGDGLSTHNPMDDKDRLKIARQMVERKIAFFPVPLGVQLDPKTLHGLANSTGGVVLRTRVEEEKLVDALKRYEDAFAGPILYSATLALPAEASGVCPTVLPPLRSDTPTLVVGRLSKGVKQFDHTLAGIQPGRQGEVKVQTSLKVLAPDLDNFFLVSMIDQWARAKEQPALLRADRALANAYENTRLEHLNKLESAHMALEENQLEAAGRLFRQARLLAPHDGQADAGIKIVERLQDGTLTRDTLRKQLDQRNTKVDQLKVVNGKQQWVKVDLVPIAQNDANGGVKNAKPGLGGEDLIKEQRDRQVVEEQKVANAVDDTIRQARRHLPADPDGMLDLLRGLLNRVKDHPDLGGRIRDALTARLQAALHNTAKDVLQIKLRKQDRTCNRPSQAAPNDTAEQARRTFVERTEAQFRAYKGLMNIGRLEERTKTAILEAMVQIQQDARANGMPTPLATRAAYDIALAGHTVQQHQSLVRRREEGWLAVLMNVEKAHMPYPDEPGIYFPPLTTWKAILKARKDKYAVSMLPNDEHGIAEATEISRLLQQVIDTKGLQEKVKLKTALEYFADKFGGKLPILVDREAFADGQAEAADPYEEEVSLPPVPARMAMSTALRLVLAQVGKGKATYLIRRSFVEITTNERDLADKVLRVYPVGDLVMPIGQAPAMGGVGLQFGGGQGGDAVGGRLRRDSCAGGEFGAQVCHAHSAAEGFGGFPGQPGGGFGAPFGAGFGAPFGGGFGGFPGQPGGGFGGFPGQPGNGFVAPFGARLRLCAAAWPSRRRARRPIRRRHLSRRIQRLARIPGRHPGRRLDRCHHARCRSRQLEPAARSATVRHGRRFPGRRRHGRHGRARRHGGQRRHDRRRPSRGPHARFSRSANRQLHRFLPPGPRPDRAGALADPHLHRRRVRQRQSPTRRHPPCASSLTEKISGQVERQGSEGARRRRRGRQDARSAQGLERRFRQGRHHHRPRHRHCRLSLRGRRVQTCRRVPQGEPAAWRRRAAVGVRGAGNRPGSVGRRSGRNPARAALRHRA